MSSRVSHIESFVLALLLATALLARPAHASGQDPIPQIERWMREYQARHLFVTGKTVAWPSCCGTSSTPAFPADDYYDESLKGNTPLAVELVGSLHFALTVEAAGKPVIYPSFLRESPAGRSSGAPLPLFTSGDLESTSVTQVTAQNFMGVFSSLVSDIGKLEDFLSGTGVEWEPQGAGGGFYEFGLGASAAAADAIAKSLAEALYATVPAGTGQSGPSVYERSAIAFFPSDPLCPPVGDSPYRAGRVYSCFSARPVLDLRGLPSGHPAKSYLAVDVQGGIPNPAPPVEGDEVWREYVEGTTGSRATGEVAGEVPGSPPWSLATAGIQNVTPCEHNGIEYARWLISSSIVVVSPEWDISPDAGRCGGFAGASQLSAGCSSCTSGKPTVAMASPGVNAVWALGSTPLLEGAGYLQIRGREIVSDMADWSKLAATTSLGVANWASPPGRLIDTGRVRVFIEDATPASPVGNERVARVSFLLPGQQPGGPDSLTSATVRYSESGSGAAMVRRLEIVQTGDSPGRWEYRQSASGWEFDSGVSGGTPATSASILLVPGPGPNETSMVRTLARPGQAAPDFREVVVRRRFAWGDEVVARSLGAQGQERWETWTFDDQPLSGGSPNPAYGRMVGYADDLGHWAGYSYGTDGRIARVVRPFQNGQPSAGPAANDVTDYRYFADSASGALVVERVRTVLGAAVEQSYTAEFLDQPVDIPYGVGSTSATELWSVDLAVVDTARNPIQYLLARRSSGAWRGGSDRVRVEWLESSVQRRLLMSRSSDGTMTVSSPPASNVGTTVTHRAETGPDWQSVLAATRSVSVRGADGSRDDSSLELAPSAPGAGPDGFKLTRRAWSLASDLDGLGRPLVTRFDDDGDGVQDACESRTFACCGVASETDRHGVVTTYGYDALGRRTTASRMVGPGQWVTTTAVLDSLGNELSVVRSAGGSSLLQSAHTYDQSGRLTGSTDAAGLLTTYALAATPDGIEERTTRWLVSGLPNTVRRVNYLDGSPRSVGGAPQGHESGAHPERYSHGIQPPATGQPAVLYSESTRGGPTSAEWVRSYTDALGRPVRTAYAGGYAVDVSYTPDGRTQTTLPSDTGEAGSISLRGVGPGQAPAAAQALPAMLALMDGEWELSVVDMDRDGQIDFSTTGPNATADGTDRITLTVSRLGARPEGGAQVPVRETLTYVWSRHDSATETLKTAHTQTTLDGLRGWSYAIGQGWRTTETVHNADGSVTVASTDPAGARSERRSSHGLVRSERRLEPGPLGTLEVVQKVGYGYDAHGRMVSTTRDYPVPVTTTTSYDNADRPLRVITPSPAGGYLFTDTRYDPFGRVEEVSRITSGGQVLGATGYTYHSTGELSATSGHGVTPVAYEYDDRGRMKAMTTFKDGVAATGPARTEWNYDPQRGFLTSKRYAPASPGAPPLGPDYQYAPSGRMTIRQWARPAGAAGTPRLRSNYSYNRAGELVAIEYNDASTPTVQITRDRLGREVRVRDGAGDRTIGYESGGLRPAVETYDAPAGIIRKAEIAHTYAGDLRSAVVAKVYNDAGSRMIESTTEYEYDQSMRPSAVVNRDARVEYDFNRSLGGRTAVRASFGGLPVMTGQYSYTTLGLVNEVEWQAAGRPAWASDRYIYGYDALGRRTMLEDKRGYRWDYAYDRLNQLSEAKASFQPAPPELPDPVPVPGSQFEYTHDDVGNRVRVYNQYAADPTIEDVQDYSSNDLNQYTQRTDAGWAILSGESDPAAGMQIGVDGAFETADKGPAPYNWKFFHARHFNNAAGALVKDFEFISAAGAWAQRAFIPDKFQDYAYDADGNLVEDGVWSYRWDAENRLSSMTMRPTVAVQLLNAPAGQQPWLTLEFAYDFMHRRVSKRALSSLTDPTKISDKEKVQYEWKASYAERYVYDTGSFNLLVSYRVDPQGPEAGPGVGGSFLSRGRSYAWGPDLSGTVDGGGGIGGLAVCFDDLSDAGGGSGYVGPLFPTFDGNGNLMRLYDSAAVERASYEYGPFGEPRSRLGSQASANPFRFSTKFADDETGLVYYGYRYYSAQLGRWVGRDPIEEGDHPNLYAFVRNSPSQRVDLDGRQSVQLPFMPMGGGPGVSRPTVKTDSKKKGFVDPTVDFHQQAGAYYDIEYSCGSAKYRDFGYSLSVKTLIGWAGIRSNRACCCVSYLHISTHHSRASRNADGTMFCRAQDGKYIDGVSDTEFVNRLRFCEGAVIILNACNSKELAERIARKCPSCQIRYTNGTNYHLPPIGIPVWREDNEWIEPQ